MSEFEIIAKIGDVAIIKKFVPEAKILLAKFSDKEEIIDEIEIKYPANDEQSYFTEKNKESGFYISGKLREIHPNHGKSSGYGVIENNENLNGFWFKREDVHLIEVLNKSVGDFIVVTGKYNNITQNFNPKAPVFNFIKNVSKIVN